MNSQSKKTTLTKNKPNQLTNPSASVEKTYFHAPDELTFSTNECHSHQILHKHNSKQLKKSHQIKRKTRNFTLSEDQKILHLVLTLGPKFKQIAKKITGKSINVIKNRYYRDLRYRWDDVLGNYREYIHLNVKKEESYFDTLVANSQMHQDLSNILIPMLSQIQTVINQFLH
ncbi:unnamed protein product (macronuclear) [Paramecium tetraurelia]|uniref:Myb-like domain-containing protein n=1 Tax=Paramecium tetraurelia TaxID=5888 RepID=A0CCH2_PARTE|nr:uncharacterized protein GSPATT00037274001 [Paramecium tetraurelia]CAK68489.1 unnamed protein product [Paramecium tetraurelia]|eukprot:XP_001435886.1 hypothetical protein (macronuclear) [Paramecium tetraurelia strain d4-2]